MHALGQTLKYTFFPLWSPSCEKYEGLSMESETWHKAAFKCPPLAPTMLVCLMLWVALLAGSSLPSPSLLRGKGGNSNLQSKGLPCAQGIKRASERSQSCVLEAPCSRTRIVESVDRDDSTSWLKGLVELSLSSWCPVTSPLAVSVPQHAVIIQGTWPHWVFTLPTLKFLLLEAWGGIEKGRVSHSVQSLRILSKSVQYSYSLWHI